jgi:hypothetical protein
MIQWWWLAIEFVVLFLMNRVVGLVFYLRYRKTMRDKVIQEAYQYPNVPIDVQGLGYGLKDIVLSPDANPDLFSTGITPGGVSFQVGSIPYDDKPQLAIKRTLKRRVRRKYGKV